MNSFQTASLITSVANLQSTNPGSGAWQSRFLHLALILMFIFLLCLNLCCCSRMKDVWLNLKLVFSNSFFFFFNNMDVATIWYFFSVIKLKWLSFLTDVDRRRDDVSCALFSFWAFFLRASARWRHPKLFGINHAVKLEVNIDPAALFCVVCLNRTR